MMFRNTRTIRTVSYAGCAVLLLTWVMIATAQDKPREVRHISLEEVKGKAAGAAVSKVGELEINAAKYHRQAVQADYFPKLSADFLNLHYNKFMGQSIQLFRREASVPLFGKDWTAVALTVVQPVTQLLQVRQAVTIARADERIASAKVAQMSTQAAESVERVYFTLLIAHAHHGQSRLVNGCLRGRGMASWAPLDLSDVVEHRPLCSGSRCV